VPQVLLAPHLKALKLPTFLREYDKQARQYDLPLEKWTPGYAVFRSACSGVM
jgi:hypothetical protein